MPFQLLPLRSYECSVVGCALEDPNPPPIPGAHMASVGCAWFVHLMIILNMRCLGVHFCSESRGTITVSVKAVPRSCMLYLRIKHEKPCLTHGTALAARHILHVSRHVAAVASPAGEAPYFKPKYMHATYLMPPSSVQLHAHTTNDSYY